MIILAISYLKGEFFLIELLFLVVLRAMISLGIGKLVTFLCEIRE